MTTEQNSGRSRSRRRGHHEGTLYEIKRNGKPTGRWRAQVSAPDGTRLSKTGPRQEVLRWRDAQLRAVREGTFVAPTRLTLAQFLTRWLTDVVQPNRAGSTFLTYQSLTRHAISMLGHAPLAALRPDHLQRLYTARLAAGMSRTSVNMLHTILSSALKQAVRWGLLARNVADAVTPPTPDRHEMQALSPAEARHLLEVLQTEPLYPLYVLAIVTGMRQGELLALRWADIDLTQGTVKVSHTLLRRHGVVELGQTKTRQARTVVLGEATTDILRAHRARCEPPPAAGDFVFTTEDGRPINAATLRHAFQRLLAHHGFRQIRFHDLRHTAVTLLLSEGVHIKVVQERVGHADITTTLRTYAHVLPTMQEDAAARVQARLFGPQPNGNVGAQRVQSAETSTENTDKTRPQRPPRAPE